MKCKLRKSPKYKKRKASIEVKKRSFVDYTKVKEQQKKSESIGGFFTSVREFFSGT